MSHQVTNNRQLRTLARLTFGNTASRIYLGLVLAASVFVAVDTLFVSHEDASFAGVWVFFLAAPTVFVFLLGSSMAGADAGGPAWFIYLALVVSVLVQACALGWFSRLLLRGPRRGGSAHPQGA
ncbi:SCO4225 family membrane protein [Streptomyces sp. NPDC048438]|uniref:SCO4225 family membrane protein n=1 Tax=Streptomyces sp. NPDC048438 TaxID=3365551 RepID=UPI00371C5A70